MVWTTKTFQTFSNGRWDCWHFDCELCEQVSSKGRNRKAGKLKDKEECWKEMKPANNKYQVGNWMRGMNNLKRLFLRKIVTGKCWYSFGGVKMETSGGLPQYHMSPNSFPWDYVSFYLGFYSQIYWFSSWTFCQIKQQIYVNKFVNTFWPGKCGWMGNFILWKIVRRQEPE